MDFHNAIKILELNNYNFTLDELKQQYYKMSLKWHPDKNILNENNSTSKFQEISTAYEFLKLNKENNNSNNEIYISYIEEYFYLLIGNVANKEIIHNAISNIFNHLKNNCDKMCDKMYIKLFKDFDKETSFKLYNYLQQYSEILNISNETLDIIQNIIKEKFKNDNIIILHPTIDNLLDDELYKLEFNKEIYYIPLWHHELIYDTPLGELQIKITPILDKHISIDNNNNININLTKNINGLLTTDKIIFNLGKKVFEIKCSELNIIKNQTICIKQKGIPIINLNNIYNISYRSNININLILFE